MAKEFNTSTSVINYYLNTLKEWGMIDLDKRSFRDIKIAGLREVTLYVCPVRGCPVHTTEYNPPLPCPDHHQALVPRLFREL
jgi:hypothetical protein